jgi:putative phosphoribosyl transferase
VIVVDDSAATGATLRTAVKAVRALGAREIVVAVPVAPPRVLDRLRGQVDHLVCPATPAALIVQGIHYPAPLAMSDDDIRILLEQGSATPDEPTSEGSEVD